MGPKMASKQKSSRCELQRDLEAGEIIPYFQPVVQIRTGTLLGFEVLARWRHPCRGMVPPDQFIPLAERAGMIGKLTESILLQALAATAALPAELQIAINISPIQLRDRSLPAQIRQAAEQVSFPLRRLTIEITESALVDNLELANSIAAELKGLGVSLSLDDFGTGYSSLCHLQALPFDALKVDHSFVRSMPSNRESRKIVAAVVGLGQSLGLTTVAEGIETDEQAEILRWLGCDQGQGWLYGKPVPAEALLDTISRIAAKASSEDGGSYSLSGIVEPLPAQRLAQYQAIYDGAPVGLCLVDRNLQVVNINQRLADIYGRPVSSHIGRRVSELLSPELFAQLEPYHIRALNGEPTSGVEVREPKYPGAKQLNTLLMSYQPARDEAGEIIGISVAVMDITDRRQVEEALHDGEDHHRHMVDLIPQMPWVMDADGRNLEVSAAWAEITGQTVEQALGPGWMAALHPEDLAKVEPVVRASLRTGDPIDIEYRVRTKEGKWRWVRSRGKALRGPDGRILRWYGCGEDIDEHKKVQQALHQTEAKLASLLRANSAGETKRTDWATAALRRIAAQRPAFQSLFWALVHEEQSSLP